MGNTIEECCEGKKVESNGRKSSRKVPPTPGEADNLGSGVKAKPEDPFDAKPSN